MIVRSKSFLFAMAFVVFSQSAEAKPSKPLFELDVSGRSGCKALFYLYNRSNAVINDISIETSIFRDGVNVGSKIVTFKHVDPGSSAEDLVYLRSDVCKGSDGYSFKIRGVSHCTVGGVGYSVCADHLTPQVGEELKAY